MHAEEAMTELPMLDLSCRLPIELPKLHHSAKSSPHVNEQNEDHAICDHSRQADYQHHS